MHVSAQREREREREVGEKRRWIDVEIGRVKHINMTMKPFGKTDGRASWQFDHTQLQLPDIEKKKNPTQQNNVQEDKWTHSSLWHNHNMVFMQYLSYRKLSFISCQLLNKLDIFLFPRLAERGWGGSQVCGNYCCLLHD